MECTWGLLRFLMMSFTSVQLDGGVHTQQKMPTPTRGFMSVGEGCIASFFASDCIEDSLRTVVFMPWTAISSPVFCTQDQPVTRTHLILHSTDSLHLKPNSCPAFKKSRTDVSPCLSGSLLSLLVLWVYMKFLLSSDNDKTLNSKESTREGRDDVRKEDEQTSPSRSEHSRRQLPVLSPPQGNVQETESSTAPIHTDDVSLASSIKGLLLVVPSEQPDTQRLRERNTDKASTDQPSKTHLYHVIHGSHPRAILSYPLSGNPLSRDVGGAGNPHGAEGNSGAGGGETREDKGAWSRDRTSEDMRREAMRLRSLAGLPSDFPQSSIRLAQAGWYRGCHGDQLECFQCRVRHSGWTAEDCPVRVHMELSPHCAFLQHPHGSNVPILTTSDPSLCHQGACLLRATPAARSLSAILARRDSTSARSREADQDRTGSSSERPQSSTSRPVSTPQASSSRSEQQPAQHLPNSIQSPLLPVLTAAAGPGILSDEGDLFADGHSESPAVESYRTGEITTPTPPENREASRQNVGPGGDAGGSEPRGHLLTSTSGSAALPQGAGIGTPGSGLSHPQYASQERRLASFSRWPSHLRQRPQALVRLGFFYAGFGDCVRCFCCGLGLKDWSDEDIPLYEHIRWRNSCSHLRSQVSESQIYFIMAQMAREAQGGDDSEDEEGRYTEEELRRMSPSDLGVVLPRKPPM